jgi:hypothetical protein
MVLNTRVFRVYSKRCIELLWIALTLYANKRIRFQREKAVI